MDVWAADRADVWAADRADVWAADRADVWAADRADGPGGENIHFWRETKHSQSTRQTFEFNLTDQLAKSLSHKNMLIQLTGLMGTGLLRPG